MEWLLIGGAACFLWYDNNIVTRLMMRDIDQRYQHLLLVPPIMTEPPRRDTMARSSFDLLVSKHQRLLQRHIATQMGSLRLSLVPETHTIKKPSNFQARVSMPYGPSVMDGDVHYFLRPVPGKLDHWLTITGSLKGMGKLTGCAFDDESGVGVFGSLPIFDSRQRSSLDFQRSDITGSYATSPTQEDSNNPTLGVRYTRQEHCMGAVASWRTGPLFNSLLSAPSAITAWFTKLYRVQNGVVLRGGLQGTLPFHKGGRERDDESESKHPLSSWIDTPRLDAALHVSAIRFGVDELPSGRHGQEYEMGLQARDMGRELVFTYVQHLIGRRHVYNPLEKGNVVGIDQYITLGMELKHVPNYTKLVGSPEDVRRQRQEVMQQRATGMDDEQPETTLQVSGAWQMNKNLLAKGFIGYNNIGFSSVLRFWTMPSAEVTMTARHDFDSDQTRLGFEVSVDNLQRVSFVQSSPESRQMSVETQRRPVRDMEDV